MAHSNPVLQFFSRRFLAWQARRLPPATSVTLNSKRLFIFPSKAGFGFACLLVICWLVATNYENNIVFGFTCLLAAIFWVGILKSFANLSGISVSYLRSTPAFAGEEAIVSVGLKQRAGKFRDGIQLSFPGSETLICSMPELEEVVVKIPLPATRRGWLNPGRLMVESVYPLGLLRVWVRLDLEAKCLVYPRLISAEPTSTAVKSTGDGPLQMGEGTDDFVGLDDYRHGDTLNRIAWKHYARGQGVYVKHYADAADEQIWLDWEAFPGLDTEARLSRLCGWLLMASTGNSEYGLRVPGVEIAPASGEQHRLAILRELALYGVEEREA